MSKYLLIVLVLLRFVVASNPCDGPCGPLNATIAACGTTNLMSCLCNNLQFTSNSQPCYNCYQAQGDTALAGQIQTFLNLCGNGGVPNIPNNPTAVPTPVFNGFTTVVSADGVVVSVTVPSISIPVTIPISIPSPSIPSVSISTGLVTTTRPVSSSPAVTTFSSFSSDGSKRVVEYWKI